MEQTIKGTCVKRLPIQTTSTGKQILTIIVEQPGDYPKNVAITFFDKSVHRADIVDVGVEAEYSVNIESREYNEKYYTDVKCWKVNVISQGQALPEQDQSQLTLENNSDDLPF